MVVGRSVNGWDVKWEHGKYQADSPTETVNQAQDISVNYGLQWVDRVVGHSAFWQVIRGVAQRLSPELHSDDNLLPSPWSQSLAWSNLYKVAPHSPRGTGLPSSALQRAQLESCKRILACEIEECGPKRVLFLVATNKRSGVQEPPEDDYWFVQFKDVVERTCQSIGAKYVVCRRPEFKAREPVVDCIIRKFED